MLERVVQRLLGNAIQTFLDFRRKPGLPLHLKPGLQPGPPLHGFQTGLQRADETFPLQHGRAQLKDHQPHFAHRFLGRLSQLLQIVGSLLHLAVHEQAGGGLGVHGHAVDFLRDRIVQFARQPLAFAQRGHLSSLFVETGVLDGNGRLVAQGLEHG